MTAQMPVLVFGEALFDCFPGGETVLGGAPFNVAWHLQALGQQPHFISAIGDDELGKSILTAMHDWGMQSDLIQVDPDHQTGQVQVILKHGQPEYTITSDCAYDYIAYQRLDNLPTGGILYHGSLALRNHISHDCLTALAQQSDMSIFLDVNLRSPWWDKEAVFQSMKQASWVKLNDQELEQLGFSLVDIEGSMRELLSEFDLQQLILTLGEKGAIVLTADGESFQQAAEPVETLVDTVGAGDGFSALYIHGLTAGWPVEQTLNTAQHFAGKIISLRGATPNDQAFYQPFLN